jgi:hypothetical protein
MDGLLPARVVRRTIARVYAESFRDQPYLDALVNEAPQIVDNALL